jgi:hypothetical protein
MYFVCITLSVPASGLLRANKFALATKGMAGLAMLFTELAAVSFDTIKFIPEGLVADPNTGLTVVPVPDM